MNRLLWELRRAQWRLGAFGLLAMLMIGAAAVIALMQIVPLREDIATREADLNARAAKLRQPPPPSPDEAVEPESAEQRYFVFLHSLLAIAAKNQIVLPQVTYSVPAQDKGSPLRRYTVETTFNSTYPQLRGFLVEIRTLPGIRCERLTVSRPNISVTQLEVRLQCSFLVEATQ
jgi:hypothetical protein